MLQHVRTCVLVACSFCKEKGHDKRRCPKQEKIQEQIIKLRRDRVNVVLGSPAFSTLSTALVFATLSQSLQARGFWSNMFGEILDLSAVGTGLFRGEPSLILGGMISQLIFEGFSLDEITSRIDKLLFPEGVVTGATIDPETGEITYPSSILLGGRG